MEGEKGKNLTKEVLESKLDAKLNLWVQGFSGGAGGDPLKSFPLWKALISKTFMIKNKFGLHARPSASFVQMANRFHCEIKVEKDGQVADGKSIMDLMMLAASQGAYITVNAQGEDALEALEALEGLIEGQFGEE
jgi:phosphocarrier protein